MPSAKQAALKAIRVLQRAGYEAYLAGGCVRDSLLGKTPKDYDVATSASPDMVQALLPRTRAIGKQFGVIQADVFGHNIEIATFRSDHTYADGRRPSGVTFCDAREDAKRRDFTINAIFFEPSNNMYIDYCHGIMDLQKRVLRCVGTPSKRFKEDHLRMMRAIRFAYTLGFQIEPGTASAIQKHSGMIAKISCERIRDELFRILTESSHPGRAVTAMARLGLLQHILPRTFQASSERQLKGITANLNRIRHYDVSAMLMTLLIRTGARAGKRISAADIPLITASTEQELLQLKCPRNQIKTVLKAQALYWKLHLPQHFQPCNLLPELAENYADITISAMQAAKSPDVDQLRRLSRRVKRRLAQPLISGDDLKAIGIAPGPEMKTLLEQARIIQAQGRAGSKSLMLKRLRQS